VHFAEARAVKVKQNWAQRALRLGTGAERQWHNDRIGIATTVIMTTIATTTAEHLPLMRKNQCLP